METLRTYDISFDQEKALETKNTEQFASYLTAQMETNLGERFNVSISKFNYEIREGQLWGKDMDEPFISSLKRGRDYRLSCGNLVDRRREQAEVVGFEKIQNTLLDPNTSIGTNMLSISPPGLKGSSYQHNFYDIFTLKVNNRGEKFVEARRYASGLNVYEYKNKLVELENIELDESDPAASLLENPILIKNTFTPDDIHFHLHQENGFMGSEEFDVIKRYCKDVIDAYIDAIIQEPKNDLLHKILFNTILNKADDVNLRLKEGSLGIGTIELINIGLREEAERYGFSPVTEVATGCGQSGGYEIAQEKMNSQFSVISYVKDKYGERTFDCPDCKKENVRPYNKLLSQCQYCKSKSVAC